MSELEPRWPAIRVRMKDDLPPATYNGAVAYVSDLGWFVVRDGEWCEL